MCCPQDQTSILNQDQGNHLNLRKKEIHVHYLHIKWPKAKSVKLNCFLMLSVCFCQKLYLYGSIPLFHCSTYISIFLIFKCGRFSEDHLTGWITWSGGVTTPTVTPTISPQTPTSFLIHQWVLKIVFTLFFKQLKYTYPLFSNQVSYGNQFVKQKMAIPLLRHVYSLLFPSRGLGLGTLKHLYWIAKCWPFWVLSYKVRGLRGERRVYTF